MLELAVDFYMKEQCCNIYESRDCAPECPLMAIFGDPNEGEINPKPIIFLTENKDLKIEKNHLNGLPRLSVCCRPYSAILMRGRPIPNLLFSCRKIRF